MIPSGYKEDVVYSQIPTNGNGDLSFTRASNGTRINSAGLVEVCPWNLVQQSETLDNTAWTKQQSTVTANAITAPNGTATADFLVPNTNNDLHSIFQTSGITSGKYTISVYAKQGGYKNLLVWFDGHSGGIGVNLDTLAIFRNQNNDGYLIETLANGWYRISVTCTISTASLPNFYIYDNSSTPAISFAGNGTSGVYLWGAQMNYGALKPYFPTTDRLNVPRLTYQNGGGGCPSLLLEKQSTNLVRNWDFTQSVWDKSVVTVVANSGTSPDGTNNAFLIYPTSSGTDRFVYDSQGSASYTANAEYTTTVYAKAAGLNFAYIRFEDKSNANSYVYFNLSTGVVGSTTGSVTIISKTIESMGNGWYRLRVTANMGTGSGGRNNVLFGVANADGSTQATTSGTNGVLFYGPQSEQSSYPTSPIQTSGSSATRVADAVPSKSTLLADKNNYSMFLDFYPRPTATFSYFFIQKNSSDSAEIIWGGTSDYLGFSIYDYTVSQTVWTGNINDNNRHKICLSVASGKIDLFVDGVQVVTQKSTSQTGFYLVAMDGGPGVYKINEMVILPKITSTEAIALTTL